RAKPMFTARGFDFYMALLPLNARSVVTLMAIFYAKHHPAEVQAAQRLYEELHQLSEEAGYQQYRTSVLHMPTILDRAPVAKEMMAKIKAALDPRHILAPGKYGM